MMKPATGPVDRFSDFALLDSPLVQNHHSLFIYFHFFLCWHFQSNQTKHIFMRLILCFEWLRLHLVMCVSAPSLTRQADGRRVKSSGDEATEAGNPPANQGRVMAEDPVRIHRDRGQPRVPVRNRPGKDARENSNLCVHTYTRVFTLAHLLAQTSTLHTEYPSAGWLLPPWSRADQRLALQGRQEAQGGGARSPGGARGWEHAHRASCGPGNTPESECVSHSNAISLVC